MMALPLMVLYEISIIGARVFGKKKAEEVDVEDPDTPEKEEGTEKSEGAENQE